MTIPHAIWPRLMAAVLATAGALLPIPCPADSSQLSLSPRTLRVGTFSGTERLRISGRVRAGAEVVVVVRGQDVEETFNRKARFGFIWVTAGKVEISGAPALFLSFARRPVESLLSRQAIDRFVLDERALVSHLIVTPREADGPEVRDSYLRLKLDDGSYRIATSGLELGAPTGGQIRFALELPWPATAPPGPYRVLAYECSNGAVVGTSSASFDVMESAFAAGMKHLAQDHGAVYGVMAVGITLSVGLGLDFALAWVRRRRGAGRRRRAESLVREDVGVH